MESAAVFLVGVAIILLVFWIVRNDGVSIRNQRGLFRMRVPMDSPPDADKGKPVAPGRGSREVPR